MRTLLTFGLAALAFSTALASSASAEDSKAGTVEKAEESAERAEDCEWSRLANDELSLMCFDTSGNPSPLFVVTCGDGTVITYLGAGPNSGCNSAIGTNECRTHGGCVSIQ